VFCASITVLTHKQSPHYVTLDLLILLSPAADETSNCTNARHHCLKQHRRGVRPKVLELQ
jgi:hypothetical protein